MTLIKMIGKNHKIVWEKKKKMDIGWSLLVLCGYASFCFMVIMTAAIHQIKLPLGVSINCILFGVIVILVIVYQKREEVYVISLLYKDKKIHGNCIYKDAEVNVTEDYLTDRNKVARAVDHFEVVAKLREVAEKDNEVAPGDDRDKKVFEGL